MALTREWYPSPNYSGGGTKRLIVLHTTEGFTGPNGMYDLAHYFSGSGAGASSQVGIDNTHPGVIVEMVSPSKGAWTQCNYNSVSVSAEQCGYASWSRDVWLNDKEALLRNTAAWIAEEADRFGIPITKLSPSSAQGSGRGVCYHSDLGSVGCGHADPGSGYPVDVVLGWASGGTSAPPQPVLQKEDDMPCVPPKNVSDRQVSVCLNGPHKDFGLLADASTLKGSVHVRVAFHLVGGGWQVIEVYADNTSNRPVVTTSKPYDGVSMIRQDDQPVDVWPVFV